MVCEAVDFICKIDELHISLIVVGRGAHIELNATAREVIYGAINVVGLYCNVTVSAGTLFVHHFEFGGIVEPK